jgi:PGF-pre-PGF domain-containing protein
MKKSDINPPGKIRQKNVYSPVWLSLAIFVMIALCVVPVWAENVSGVNLSDVGGDEGDAVIPLLNSSPSNESEIAPLSASPLLENTSEVSNETNVPMALLQSTVLSSTGGVITATDDVYLTVANNDGVLFNDFGNNTFHIIWTGGGLNSLHISNGTPSYGGLYYGEVTTTSDQSGTFYVTTTGGRGYQDDIFLCVAVNGTIPDDFRLHLVAEGCQWTPSTTPHTAPPSSAITYDVTTLDEWFTKDDLIYGPQTWRPAVKTKYPLYVGQNVDDTSNQFRMMFVDLNGGVLTEHPLRVRYEFLNLNTSACFNVYGYAQHPDPGIDYVNSWTNCLSETGDKNSGWYVSGVPIEPPARVNITSSDVEVPVNGKKIFTATAYDIYDEEISGAVFHWTSSNTTVGTIDQNGLFTPKALGDTEINVTCTGGASDSVHVTVVPAVPIVLDTIVLSPSNLDLYSDDTRTYRLNAAGYDQFGDIFSVDAYTWSSTNGTVCTVNETGFVRIIGAGNATITASSGSVSGTAGVTIFDRPDWTLDLIGAVNQTLNRTEFIDLAKAHPATYTDNKGYVWEGVNLSVLIGLVDDTDPATLNQTLANALYKIFVTSSQIGEDNCSIVTSDELVGDRTFVVAYKLNGEEIPGKTVDGKMYWPLRLHGSGCAVNSRSLAQVAKIEFSIRPAVSKLELNAIHRWDNDRELYKIPISAYDESGSVISDEKYVLRYEWKSSNESVGTVDKDGYFSVKGAGTTRVTALFGDTTATADVIVYRSADDSHILNVDGSGKTGFKTIPEAIAFSQDRDIIVVKNGTYAEVLNIDKAVTIRSENGSSGTIIPAKVDINSDNVSLEGLTVNNNVAVNSGFRDCVIDHCVIDGYNKYDGVLYLYPGSSNCTISNNTVINTKGNYAIYIYSSADNLIVNNNLKAPGGGINFGWSASPTKGNIIKDNDFNSPLCIFSASDTIVENNTIIMNTSNGYPFVGYGCQNVTVVNNTIIGNTCQSAMFLFSFTGCKVCNNRISGGSSATILAYTSLSQVPFYQNEISGTAGKILCGNSATTLNSVDPVTYVFNNNTYTGIIGNHYSDYTGEDATGDGIGETPYVGTKITDNYPLISPIDNYLVLTPTTVTVSPATTTLEVAESVDFTAEVFDQRGEKMSHAVPVWSSSDPTLGWVNAATGRFEALSPGSVTVTADCDGCTASAVVTVVPATKKTETISFAIPNCTFTDTGSGHSISFNESAASTNDGRRITLPGNGFTLTVQATSDPVTAGGRVNATYDGMVLETDPLVADLPLPGTVSGSIRANLTGLPAGAGITTTLNQNITAEAMSAFQLAAGGAGLRVDAVAFTMNIMKTNLTNDKDIADATIRMTVSSAWVNAHGGSDAVQIIRWADNGTKEMLATAYLDTDADGNMVFEAYSPNGLSVFGLAAVSRPTPDQPAGRSSSSGGGPSNVAAFAGSIPEGETQSFAVKGLAIERITVEAWDAVSDLLVTVEKVSLPKEIETPGPTVYEIDRAVLYRADPSSIAGIVIEFSVPKTWLDAHGLSSGQITLLQYADGRWKSLQTTLLKEDEGRAYYSAGTDEFSYFAIVPGTAASAGSQVQAEETTMPTGEAVQTASPSPSATTLPQKSPLLGGLAILAFGAVFMMRRR